MKKNNVLFRKDFTLIDIWLFIAATIFNSIEHYIIGVGLLVIWSIWTLFGSFFKPLFKRNSKIQ
jgi:hypothetical protein